MKYANLLMTFQEPGNEGGEERNYYVRLIVQFKNAMHLDISDFHLLK